MLKTAFATETPQYAQGAGAGAVARAVLSIHDDLADYAARMRTRALPLARQQYTRTYGAYPGQGQALYAAYHMITIFNFLQSYAEERRDGADFHAAFQTALGELPLLQGVDTNAALARFSGELRMNTIDIQHAKTSPMAHPEDEGRPRLNQAGLALRAGKSMLAAHQVLFQGHIMAIGLTGADIHHAKYNHTDIAALAPDMPSPEEVMPLRDLALWLSQRAELGKTMQHVLIADKQQRGETLDPDDIGFIAPHFYSALCQCSIDSVMGDINSGFYAFDYLAELTAMLAKTPEEQRLPLEQSEKIIDSHKVMSRMLCRALTRQANMIVNNPDLADERREKQAALLAASANLLMRDFAATYPLPQSGAEHDTHAMNCSRTAPSPR